MPSEDEVLYEVQLILDPGIRFFVIAAGIFLVFILLRKIMPKMNVAFNPFQKLAPVETEEKKTAEYNNILKAIIQSYRAINRSGVQSDDKTILQNFFVSSGLSFIVTYFVYGIWTGLIRLDDFQFFNLFDFWLIVFSAFAFCGPFVILYIRLHRIRVQNSYDLVPAISTLLSKYRYYKGNLYYAIYDMCKKDLKGDIKRAFMVLLPALQGSGTVKIEEAVEEFYFRIPYERAIELGVCIMKRVQHGDDIEQTFTFMVADMTEQKKINAKIKTENREMMQMAYLPVVLIPAIIFYNAYLNGTEKTFHYYFVHPLGFRYLVICIISCILCALIAYVIQKPRNEV